LKIDREVTLPPLDEDTIKDIKSKHGR